MKYPVRRWVMEASVSLRMPSPWHSPLTGPTFSDRWAPTLDRLTTRRMPFARMAEAAFSGPEAKNVLKGVDKISEEEWKADRMERKFARHFYDIEDKLDPITVVFLDKYCKRLAEVANNAEKTAKFLRLIVHKK